MTFAAGAAMGASLCLVADTCSSSRSNQVHRLTIENDQLQSKVGQLSHDLEMTRVKVEALDYAGREPRVYVLPVVRPEKTEEDDDFKQKPLHELKP